MVKTLIDHEKIPPTIHEIVEMLKDTEIELEESVTSKNTTATWGSSLYTNTNGRGGRVRGGPQGPVRPPPFLRPPGYPGIVGLPSGHQGG